MNTQQIAEIKGYLYGFICSGIQSEGRLWLEALEGGLQSFDKSVSTQRPELIELYKQVSQDFLEEKLNFSQTVFEESLPLPTRAYMLKKWCHGFMAGIQQSGLSLQQLNDVPDNLMEKVHYFEGISELNMDTVEITAADEAMFSQIIQLLEMVTLQIYRILNDTKPKQ